MAQGWKGRNCGARCRFPSLNGNQLAPNSTKSESEPFSTPIHSGFVVRRWGEGLRLCVLADLQASAVTRRSVQKGDHAETVLCADRIARTETDADGEETDRSIPFLRGYTALSAKQCKFCPRWLIWGGCYWH